MRIVEVGVTYRKQVSDGNYGTEAAEVHFSGMLESEENASDMAENLLTAAAEVAYERLSVSLSPTVRRAVELPKKPVAAPQPVPSDDELEEIPF